MSKRNYYDLLLKSKWWLLAVILGITVYSAKGLKTALVPDNAITVWFLETDPLLKSYYEFHEVFGNDEVILMLLKEPKGVMTKPFLDTLKTFATKVEAVDGVKQVHSLISAQDAFDGPEGLEFDKIVSFPVTEDQEKLKALEDRMLDNPLIRDRLISPDGKQAMLWIQMKVMKDIDAKRDTVIAAVDQIANDTFKDQSHPMGGVGVIYSGLNLSTQRDFGIFLSLSYLILFAIITFIFRRFTYVLGAMGVITVSCIVTLGVYGLNGHQINMFTSILPTLIIVIAIADALHFPAMFQTLESENPGKTKREIALMTLPLIFWPCVMTAATDTVGFLSLLTSPMAVMRHLGSYATLGLVTAFFASLVFMILAFMLTRKKEQKGDLERKEFAWMIRFLDWVSREVDVHKKRWIVISIIITAISAVGCGFLVTDTFTIKYLPDDHPVTLDHEEIEKNWGPYSVLEFIVRPKGGSLTNADVLNSMDAFVNEVEADPNVREGFGIHQLYHRLAKVMGKEVKPGQSMSQDLVSQLKLVLDSHDLNWDKETEEYKDNFVAPLSDQDGSVGRVTFVTDMMSAANYDRLLGRIIKVADRTLGQHAEVVPSGYMPLYIKIIDYVMTSQISSFFTALGLIAAVMLIWLKSFRLAVMSIIPNVFPIIVMLGVMGYLGINLDIATSTVAAIMIGVAVDDTIHFLHHWKEHEEHGMTWEENLKETFKLTGVPIMITSILLILSFPVLMFAGVKTVYYFGFLTTIGAVAAIFGDLIILPIMLKLWPAKAKA
ncbi:MAG: RND family transporter [Oligoflexales bacterium]